MEAVSEYFKQMKNKIEGEVFTADIGVVDRVKGVEVDVSVPGRPLLINLPTLSTSEQKVEYRVGEKVLVVYLGSNISRGVVVGKIQ